MATTYWSRDDILWRDAPLPPEDHVCEPWSVAHGLNWVEKCACGGWRNVNGPRPRPWHDRNSRRLSLRTRP